jgi:hypothetical protein
MQPSLEWQPSCLQAVTTGKRDRLAVFLRYAVTNHRHMTVLGQSPVSVQGLKCKELLSLAWLGSTSGTSLAELTFATFS